MNSFQAYFHYFNSEFKQVSLALQHCSKEKQHYSKDKYFNNLVIIRIWCYQKADHSVTKVMEEPYNYITKMTDHSKKQHPKIKVACTKSKLQIQRQ